MSKALNQIELGTTCIIKETGRSGTLQRIFHYPTKYLVENEEGNFNIIPLTKYHLRGMIDQKQA